MTGSKSSVPKELAEKVHFCGTRRLNNWGLLIADPFLCANSVTDYGMCVVTALAPQETLRKGAQGTSTPIQGRLGPARTLFSQSGICVWHLRVGLS